MNILIVGGGKVGFYLAKTFIKRNYQVTLIEINRKTCQELSKELDIPVICGDGTSVEVLAGAKAGKCDTFIATTGKDQNNLIACQIAKMQFGIKKTVARVCNPANTETLQNLGVDITVSSTKILSDLIEHEVDGAQVRFITDVQNNDVAISEYRLPSGWSKSGTMVKDIQIPEGCILIYVMRNKDLLIPRGNTVLMENDEIVALTVGNSSRELKKLFEM